ncbi:signal peptidase II [Paenibacillus abyssi]|uniref:Lipoprotein signal peptidase n=1 Tax=Paenibacillus abyssi TaxID=1340531 RepID=A0A917FVV4_9BACL|nr:signal peptidase II [Paenibacillus abyssi]GGG10082.1 lipoprotein signal peptidase [Paenibacillus abyssi]
MKYYYYWIALAVFIIDYITKKMIETNLEIGDKIGVIGNFFIITSHRNRGAAFGILQEQTLFFIIITLIVVAGIVTYIYMNRNSGKVLLLSALGLVLGGAFGNFLDRALYGEVVDFLQFNFGSYTFPIFNVADMGIVCGVGLILLDTIRSMKEEAKTNNNDNPQQDGDLNERNEQQV